MSNRRLSVLLEWRVLFASWWLLRGAIPISGTPHRRRKYRRIAVVPSPSHVVDHANPVPNRRLTGARLAAKLLGDLDHHGHPSGADGVALGLEPPIQVDRVLPPELGLSLPEQ